MPRDIALGNGSMLVTLDRRLNMRDFFYPTVGLDNHVLGHRNRMGVWADGRFSWVDQEAWRRETGYRKNTLISESLAINDEMKVTLKLTDTVHYRRNFFLRRLEVRNEAGHDREIRIFFTHDFSINESDVGDTALYDPTRNCICHYKRNRYFLVNGRTDREGLYQYAVGYKRFKGAEGTWRDAEDGALEQNPVAHGSVDSTVSLRLFLGGGQSRTVDYWIAAGTNIKEVRRENEYIGSAGPERILDDIEVYWKSWVLRSGNRFADLSQEAVDMFHRSLLIIRTQTDNGGAIIAANDSDVLMYHRDHYSYMWPRDGALVAYALDMAGYQEMTSRFFELCADILTEGGYYLHKYNADGTLGSSWHPWWKDGRSQLPIQEDETALVLFALGFHFRSYRNLEFIEALYPRLITKAADFLVSYRDPDSGLPLPSFDLWEERRGVFSFTCAAVYAALHEAAFFASLFNDRQAQTRYDRAAAEVREAVAKYLFSEDLGRFLRGIYLKADGTFEEDRVLDSSLYGIFEFGCFSPEDHRVVNTMKALQDGLWVKTEVGGIARYTDDYYFRKSSDIARVPGNPWVICTLWLAEWHIAKARAVEDLAKARELIDWAVRYALPSGVLPEQVHPYTGEDLSVSPLTWSHATFILAVEKYLARRQELMNES